MNQVLTDGWAVMKILIFILLLATLAGSQAKAVLFANQLGSGNPLSSSILLTVDPITGASTEVGPIGPPLMTGIAFGPDGTLYGGSAEFFPKLFTIDPTTGAGNVVGELGGTFIFTGIAFSPDGILYGVDEFGPLFTIDTTTGTRSIIGTTEYSNRGLAFAPDGTLYSTGQTQGGINENGLFSIDTTTGAATLVGPIGGGSFISGLTFTPDGTLFAVDIVNSRLLTLDPTTGAGSVVGPLGRDTVHGLTFRADIPEPTTLAILGLGLVGLGAMRRRRTGGPL